MKLVDIDARITALLWDDEHEEETTREMTIGAFLDEFTVEGLLEIPILPIPPQGRLIDADALIESLGIGDLPIRLTYEIRNAPTIIPTEPAEEVEA